MRTLIVHKLDCYLERNSNKCSPYKYNAFELLRHHCFLFSKELRLLKILHFAKVVQFT